MSNTSTSNPATSNPDVASMSFETALAELEKIVDSLERGDVALAESIEKYERGEALKKRCAELLGAAEARVEKIKLTRDGRPDGTVPLDPEA
jgi:exodeoxyribonuclease VII small subunit